MTERKIDWDSWHMRLWTVCDDLQDKMPWADFYISLPVSRWDIAFMYLRGVRDVIACLLGLAFILAGFAFIYLGFAVEMGWAWAIGAMAVYILGSTAVGYMLGDMRCALCEIFCKK